MRKAPHFHAFDLAWISTFFCRMLSSRIKLNSLWLSDAIWWHGSGLQHQAWTNVDFSFVRFCGILLRAISQRVPKLLLCIMSLKIKLLKLSTRGQWVNVCYGIIQGEMLQPKLLGILVHFDNHLNNATIPLNEKKEVWKMRSFFFTFVLKSRSSSYYKLFG